MSYFKKIIGKQCYLSPVNIDDSEKFLIWVNDSEISKYIGNLSYIINLEREKEIIYDMIKKSKIMSIIKADNNGCIGNIGLHEIDYINGSAEIGLLIGDKNYWNRGFGTEALTLMLDYAFNILSLKHIFLKTASFNERGHKCFENAGFKKAGILRKNIQINQKRYDTFIYDIIAEEFNSPYVESLIENREKENQYGQRLSIV